MMNATRTVLGIAAVGLAVLAFTLAPAGAAQEDKPAPGGAPATRPAGDPMQTPMLTHMQNMAKVKALLQEAKGAAEAQGDQTAANKISEALRVLEKDHQMMHQHMSQMMQKMKQRRQTMQALQRDMQKLQEEMGQSPQTQSMQAKMNQMKQQMQQMMERMQADPKEADMKCPMCEKKLGEKP